MKKIVSAKLSKIAKANPGEIKSLELQLDMLKQKKTFIPRQIDILRRELTNIPQQIDAIERELAALRREK